MKRQTIKKRLAAVTRDIQRLKQAAAETEARNLSPERIEELMHGLDSSYRGGDEGAAEYIKSLTDGERLRVGRDQDDWTNKRAAEITQEHIDKLFADGIGINQLSEAELQFIIGDFDDGIDYSRVPDSIIDQIKNDYDKVDFDDLKHRYPKRSSR